MASLPSRSDAASVRFVRLLGWVPPATHFQVAGIAGCGAVLSECVLASNLLLERFRN